jgi:hypothetical protein
VLVLVVTVIHHPSPAVRDVVEDLEQFLSVGVMLSELGLIVGRRCVNEEWGTDVIFELELRP